MFINGRAIAQDIKGRLAVLTQALLSQTGVKPGLAVLRVGEDPASQLYVSRKGVQAREVGYHFEEHSFPASVSCETLAARIEALNQNPALHGIILQLPLPEHLDRSFLLSCIDPSKDVDGLHPLNGGRLFQGQSEGFVACTPLGCLTLLQSVHSSFEGMTVGVVGCSILVGRPMAMLMLSQGATLWMANSKTPNLPELCQTAEILIVAIGKPRFIQGAWIREGATVIDVGMNRLPSGELVGDVDFVAAQERAGAITPVPGGVGPMTVASLLQNTLEAACRYATYPFSL